MHKFTCLPTLYLSCLLFGLSSLLLVLSSSALAEPVTYRTEYDARYRGLPVKATGIRELLKLEDNLYVLNSTADSMLAQVMETSTFGITGSNLIPIRYEYQRKGLGKNKLEITQFDWEKNLASHADSHSSLTAGTLDKLSYQYQLRADVADAFGENDLQREFTYQVADEEKRQSYKFRIVAEETLETPIGAMHTVQVDRIRDDKDRSTSLWLSIEHDFILVRLTQIEKSNGIQLNLRQAVVGGISL